MKKCKYCQTEIDKKAKICPNCRKKQNKFPVWLRILLGVIIIIIGISSLANDLSSTTNNSDDNSKFITLEEFNKIENGMTYEEVKDIIGSDGTVVSDTKISDSQMIIYSWYGKDEISNANFNFQDGKLINKTQIGLK